MIRATFFLFTLLLVTSNAYSQPRYIETAYAANGINVHLLQASVTNNVLTVAFMVDNATDQDADFSSMNVHNVFYTANNQKYPVLLDVDKNYLASTITSNKYSNGYLFTSNASRSQTVSIDKGKNKIAWVKFEAPKQWPVEIALPGVTPLIIQKPE